MVKQDIRGKVQTVLGQIEGSELGITLPHEHLFIDMRTSYMFVEPDPEAKKIANEKVTLENLGYIRFHIYCNKDNFLLADQDMAIREASYFKKVGGNTIVDLSSSCISRNPTGLINVSKATDLNIIMGTGYYLARCYTSDMRIDSRVEEDIAGEFVRDITVGVGDAGIKAGIIGEMGISRPMREGERKVLRAAGIAHQETGAAINIHPGGCEDSPFECVKILEEVEADLSRVAFSHMSRTFPISSRSARAKLAEKGCYLEYDSFGTDGVYPMQTPEMCPYDKANDAIRITIIKELIEDGFLERILISQDVCFKVLLQAYGGGGYSHILKTIVPMMRAKGMTEEQINTIMVENPKRLLCFG